jgi:nucleoside-diphosphate-sugar epimerase
MKILITGNMGYVGPGTLAQLRRVYPDAELIGYDTGAFAHALTNAGFLPERNLDAQHFGDVRNIPSSLLEGVNVIIHLAKSAPEAFPEINALNTIRLAEMAKQAGVQHFIDPYGPGDMEVASKLEALADEHFQVTMLQFGMACGMTDRLRLDLLLNEFVLQAITDGKILVPGDANTCISLIHVKDLARVITWAVNRKQVSDEPFLNFQAGAADWTYRRSELADIVAELIPGTLVICSAVPQEQCIPPYDYSLFQQLAPAQQPRYTLKQTILELYAGLLEMGIGHDAFDPAVFRRNDPISSLEEA